MSRAIGLMSGTSLDGVDVALIETDGEAVRVIKGHNNFLEPLTWPAFFCSGISVQNKSSSRLNVTVFKSLCRGDRGRRNSWRL